jgi:glycosyltransferase involved in cell wall biosynthesis
MSDLALVIPWFGSDLKGGAEQQAWQLATRLAARGHRMEVLTTCCRSFLDSWDANHHRPGVVREGDVVIRRFKVRRRRRQRFHKVNAQLLTMPKKKMIPGTFPFSLKQSNSFVNHGIISTALLSHLQRESHRYDRVLFLPYLYSPILQGIPLVGQKSVLVPCLHDEAYAYLQAVHRAFHACGRIIFNSEGEARLAFKLFGAAIAFKGVVAGEGVEVDGRHVADSVDAIGGIDVAARRYVLFLGRRDGTKNLDHLIRAYQRYRIRTPHRGGVELVLAGPGDSDYGDPERGIHDLGLVTEADKRALLAGCLALFQPSRNESYSRVIMEAWFYGKPVAAHSDCDATRLAVASARGGWSAGGLDGWSKLFEAVDNAESGALAEMGASGRRYAQRFADWERVLDRYEAILDGRPAPLPVESARTVHHRAVHQLVTGFTFGDAISNQAVVIRDYLRSIGFRSHIYARYLDAAVGDLALPFAPDAFADGDGLIYHHSIGSELVDFAAGFGGAKSIVYHNVTPPGFVREHDPRLADELDQGREALFHLSDGFGIAYADSGYNAKELESYGFVDAKVLPIMIDPNKWAGRPDERLMAKLADGSVNVLFVGRLIANKRQDDLIRAFRYFITLIPHSRLMLVGGYDPEDRYYRLLKAMAASPVLRNRVWLTGKVSDAALQACYRTAHLFWSMSEHEGFGVPLIEAMWHEVPVLAFKSSAIPETLGAAGMMFTTKQELGKVAVLAKMMVSDMDLREKVLAAQQRRRVDFLPASVQPVIDEMLSRMWPDNG